MNWKVIFWGLKQGIEGRNIWTKRNSKVYGRSMISCMVQRGKQRTTKPLCLDTWRGRYCASWKHRRQKRNGKPPVRPPTARESYQPCWKWSSPLGMSRSCFTSTITIWEADAHVWRTPLDEISLNRAYMRCFVLLYVPRVKPLKLTLFSVFYLLVNCRRLTSVTLTKILETFVVGITQILFGMGDGFI